MENPLDVPQLKKKVTPSPKDHLENPFPEASSSWSIPFSAGPPNIPNPTKYDSFL